MRELRESDFCDACRSINLNPILSSKITLADYLDEPLQIYVSLKNPKNGGCEKCITLAQRYVD